MSQVVKTEHYFLSHSESMTCNKIPFMLPPEIQALLLFSVSALVSLFIPLGFASFLNLEQLLFLG